jgi:excisionase family DNA binding protein
MPGRKSTKNAEIEPAVLDVKGLQAFLGGAVCLGTLYKALREGRIPHRRIGSRILIPKQRLIEWLEGRAE